MRIFKVIVIILAVALSLGSCGKNEKKHKKSSKKEKVSDKSDKDEDISEIDDSISSNRDAVKEIGDFTAEEQQIANFSRQILADTEDVWEQIFKKEGIGEYHSPKIVLYTGSTTSSCGAGQALIGPFYCSSDQCISLDMSFFTSMRQRLGANGNFAYAYVIAHEVGHHVEYLTGILDQIHAKMRQHAQGSVQANKEAVRIELLADYLAGCWAHYNNNNFASLNDSDLKEAIDCATIAGDDYLLMSAQGYAVPDSFTHGASEQRLRWFKAGYESGDVKKGMKAALQLDYNQL